LGLQRSKKDGGEDMSAFQALKARVFLFPPLLLLLNHSGRLRQGRYVDAQAYRDIRTHGCATDGYAYHGSGAADCYAHRGCDAANGDGEAHGYSHTGTYRHVSTGGNDGQGGPSDTGDGSTLA
jgi:hypothetical protein